MNMDPTRILVSWLGQTDLNASAGKKEVGLGPVAQAVTVRGFDRVVLLSNYPERETNEYREWLAQRCKVPIETHRVQLSSPVHFGEIFDAVTERIAVIRETYGELTRLTYHLSPGTPAMAAVWIIVAKTRFAAELLESSKEHGVKTAQVPFDISAELIPSLYQRPDSDLSRLSAGLVETSPAFADIVHRSSVMREVIAKAQRVAPRTVPVLIEGESGTGKELLARAIHNASPRHDRPFIAVNCGAIVAELAESEFFGHKKGSFTGAATDRKGHFEQAQGGTLFLDELGELPTATQVKLLRALQERQIVRVGDSQPIAVDVRLIAATNRNLAEEVAKGAFREDLFYRVAVAILHLPPLRQRTGDLSLLIEHLLTKINRESAAEPGWMEKPLSPGARNLLLRHSWPGNVRELLNTLTRAAVWGAAKTLTEADVNDALLTPPKSARRESDILDRPITEGLDLPGLIAEVARHYLGRAMKEAGGKKTRAAELLGLGSYQTLSNWLEKYGVHR